MYYVYILKSINQNKTYVGITRDVERRLGQHNSGKSIFTSRYKPWQIIYKEKVGVYRLARRRERYLKSGAGRRLIKQLFSK